MTAERLLSDCCHYTSQAVKTENIKLRATRDESSFCYPSVLKGLRRAKEGGIVQRVSAAAGMDGELEPVKHSISMVVSVCKDCYHVARSLAPITSHSD